MAFLQSAPAREPFLKAPASVLVLIGVLVAAHLGRVFAPAELSAHIMDQYAFIPLRYAPNALDPGSLLDRAIPFVSYMFLHADATHLIFNCLWLLAFGAVVARRFRPVLFVLFFLICGIASSALYLALNWNTPGAVIGASGAISGLMATGIRMLRVAALGGADTRTGLLPILSSQVIMFSLLWIGVNLLFGLTGIGMAGETHAIAWQAHLGGYFAGLLLTGPFDLWARKSDPDPPPLA
jgi:membrane associated rhomboid family serine protease